MGDPPGLSDQQHRALDRLSALPVMAGFYLAGGSALGIHLRHRQSADLDFFSRTPEVDLDGLKQAVAGCFDSVVVVAQTDAALRLLCDQLPIDFVRYPYPPIEPPSQVFGVGLAGIRDLAAMKLAAISRRGLRRDFLGSLRGAEHGANPPRMRRGLWAQVRSPRGRPLSRATRAHLLRGRGEDPVFPPGLDEPKWAAIKAFFLAEAPKLVS